MIYSNNRFPMPPGGLGSLGATDNGNPGGIFDSSSAESQVAASVRYYNAVSAGDVAGATKALAEWNALRSAVGTPNVNPAATLRQAQSIANLNAAKVASAAKYAAMETTPQGSRSTSVSGATSSTGVRSSAGTPSIRTAAQPTVTPTGVSTPVVTTNVDTSGTLTNLLTASQPATTTVNAQSPSPQDETTPAVTTSMLETSLGDKVQSALSSFLDTINPLNYVDTIGSNDPNKEWVSGLPNWATIGIGLAIVGIASLATGEPSYSATPSRRRVRNPKTRNKKHVTHRWK